MTHVEQRASDRCRRPEDARRAEVLDGLWSPAFGHVNMAFLGLTTITMTYRSLAGLLRLCFKRVRLPSFAVDEVSR